MTVLQATFEYVLTLQRMGYSKNEIDQAYRRATSPCSTDAVLILNLSQDLTARQKQDVRG